MPVTLIMAADGVCHPTSAALIIGQQGRHSIYPVRATMITPAVSHRCFMTFTDQAWNNDVDVSTVA